MKILSTLLLIAGILLSPVACGINPTMPLESFNRERGFPSVQAIQAGEEGMTQFYIALNPAVFLSHFQHGFPGEKTEVRLTLRSNNDEHFRGPSVELGSVSSEDPEHSISFSVPTADLDRYQLEFQCTIPQHDDQVPMIIGGELYLASLKSIREAKETVTENSQVYKELEEEWRRLSPPSTPSGGSGNFGGGTKE